MPKAYGKCLYAAARKGRLEYPQLEVLLDKEMVGWE